MSRISRAVGLLALFLLALPGTSAAQCDRSGSGDICAGGSAWYGFTQIRIQPREESTPTTTLALHSDEDFSVDIETDGPKRQRGKIIVVGGRAMLMKDVSHEKGYEIDALDGPVLVSQLAVTLLDQAFPAGPESVGTRHNIKIDQKTRAIRIATSSASGRFEAPWTLSGTAWRSNSRIEFDFRFAARAEDGPYSFAVTGYWMKEWPAVPIDDQMSLEGWAVHWLGPMTMTSGPNTKLDYGAEVATQRWKDVAALRKWISEEPARRASRRHPVDAANPGQPESISYEAVEIDKAGQRKALGVGVREYRPGIDVLAEETQHQTTSKTLSIGHGLSLSTDVYREPELSGFGLVLISDRSSCFSWEWFNRERDDVFSKLRGNGKVKVGLVTSSGAKELAAVEFLDEVTLQCEDQSNGTIYEARIKKGSVLRLRP